MPNIVGSLIAKSDLKDLGIHTEMLVDSFVDMYNNGKITEDSNQLIKQRSYILLPWAQKNSTIFLIITLYVQLIRKLYNDPFRIAQNDNVIAINNAVEVDLYGQVCSESSGVRQISGTGGQFDFIFGAYKI
jgi:acyl-CoA hydrolase